MSGAAIILAGGNSSRMGSDKGLVLLNGKPMIQYCIDTLESLNLPILIVSNNKEYEKFGFPVFADLVPEKGPLGGIYTGLFYSENDKNIVISCDTPFVSSQLLKFLIDESSNELVTISKFDGWEHPLIGVYDKKGLDVFKSILDKNELKLSVANSKLNVKVVEMDEVPEITTREFSNINTLDELKALEQ